MRPFIYSFSLPMVLFIAFIGYCVYKYSDGHDKQSKANAMCKMNYEAGKFLNESLFGKFDVTLGSWSNEVFKYIGQVCFYTVSHVNGLFDSKTTWDQTQKYNTNEFKHRVPTHLQQETHQEKNIQKQTQASEDKQDRSSSRKIIYEDE